MRLALLPAAGALALYAALAAFEATRLPHVGAWTLVVSGALLAAAAAGLVLRQLWAYVFAAVFLIVTALVYAVLGASAGGEALTGTGGGEWAGVRSLVIGMTAGVVLAACALSAVVAVTLWPAWGAVAAARSPGAWMVSTVAALAGIGLLAWLVGHGYVYRQLPKQNQCLSGNGLRCYELAADRERYPAPERQAFARRGCEAGYDGACQQLVGFLGSGHQPGSAETLALAGRCEGGNPDVCHRLGRHLLKIGDRSDGARYLIRTCELEAAWCATAARTARELGDTALSKQLLESGCAREHGRSCTALLQQVRASLGPDDLRRLELRTCLVGDVNDCRTLMRSDAASVCPLICEGTTEARMHTCGYCAREAEARGERALAEAWFATNCQHGYRWSCDDLARLRRAAFP